MSPESPPPLFSPGDSVAVLGLGVSGTAASLLLHQMGANVYASDAFSGPLQKEGAERLRARGIAAEEGHHNVNRILGAGLVVTSPGIPPTAEIRRTVVEAGVPTVAEIEVAYRHLRSRVIGVTGTNGKTTTTALCGHLLRKAGVDAITAGNIGRPLSSVASMPKQPEWVVVELSSFQLADLHVFRPEIGILTNLAPDHLDWYPNIDRYFGDKARMFQNATESSCWVLNLDNPESVDLAGSAPGTRYLASLEEHEELGGFVDGGGTLVQRLREGESEPWLHRDELRLVGAHNVMNGLLAGLAAAIVGCPATALGEGLSSFDGLPHRLQRIGEWDGILWINDSKATNTSATKVALNAFQRPLVPLLGGRHKGQSYRGLIPSLKKNARAVVCYGEAAPQLVRELGEAVRVEVGSGLPQVTRLAKRLAEPGDVVLLSPACSSYDMFPNYQERGRTFVRCVHESHGEYPAPESDEIL